MLDDIASQIEKESKVNFYVHVNGPDDLHPFSSELQALKEETR